MLKLPKLRAGRIRQCLRRRAGDPPERSLLIDLQSG